MPRKQRRRAWGSITEVQRGKKYVLRWTQNTPQGRRRLTKTFYGTYREACMELDRLHVEKSDDRPVPTIAQVYEMWYMPDMELQVSDGSMKASTIRTYSNMWRKHIEPVWGRVPADSVSPIDVQNWLLSLPKQTATSCISVARAVMDKAVLMEVADTNKFRARYRMPTSAAWTRDKSTLNFRSAKDSMLSVRGDDIEPAFIIACFGGARTGESLGVKCGEAYPLETSGVFFAVVPIRRRVSDDGELTEDGDLKNGQSVRETLVPGEMGRRLLEIDREKSAEGFSILTSVDGMPMTKAVLNGQFRKYVDIPFANLRNSWRTMAQFEWGVDSDTLEVLMGHALPGVSGKHYIRPSIEQLAEQFAETLKVKL